MTGNVSRVTTLPVDAVSRQVGTRTTPRDLVRLVKPGVTDEEADFLLWERSSFPFGSVNHWLGQVRAVDIDWYADRLIWGRQ
jgi:hypothetical protein